MERLLVADCVETGKSPRLQNVAMLTHSNLSVALRGAVESIRGPAIVFAAIDVVPHVTASETHQRFSEFSITSKKRTFSTWGDSGWSQRGKRNQLSRNVWSQPYVASQRWRAAMKYYVGLDVSTEANIDLRRGPVGIGRTKRHHHCGPEAISVLREVKGAGRGTYAALKPDRRLLGYGLSLSGFACGDLYRCASCQGGAQDADQQERPQRCYRDRPHTVDRFVQGGARQGYRQPLFRSERYWPAGAAWVEDRARSRDHVRGLLKPRPW